MAYDYHPQSSALSTNEFWADMTRSTLLARQTTGSAPDTLGVTVPLEIPKSADEFAGQLSKWRPSVIERQGPVGYDNSTTPFSDSYVQRRYDFIAGSEAVRSFAYDDATGKQVTEQRPPKGNVTVGVGFNMERPDARKVFAQALQLGDADFDKVKAGQKALSPTQIRTLFDYTVQEAESVVDQRLKGVPLKEHERQALVSMAFNGPSLIGPNFVALMQKGDKQGAFDAILNHSNLTKDEGIAYRRYKEAAMFAGMGGSGANNMPAIADYIASVRNSRIAKTQKA